MKLMQIIKKYNFILFFLVQSEQPIPEQFKTVIKGNTLNTVCVESLG